MAKKIADTNPDKEKLIKVLDKIEERKLINKNTIDDIFL